MENKNLFFNIFMDKKVKLNVNPKKFKKKSIFFLNARLSSNNIIFSLVLKKKIVFWRSSKFFKDNSKKKFKAYSKISLNLIIKDLMLFFKNLLFFKSKKFIFLKLFFKGLSKFRAFIIKTFLYKKMFKILSIVDLSLPAHNGVRACKKKRLPKKKRRRFYHFIDLKNPKKKKFLKKKNRFFFKIKTLDFKYYQDFLIKIFSFYYFFFFDKNIYQKKKVFYSSVRASSNGKHRRFLFSKIIFCNFSLFLNAYNNLRFFFICFLKTIKFNQFSSLVKSLSLTKSFNF